MLYKAFFVSTLILYLSLSFKQEKAHHDFSPWGLQIPSLPQILLSEWFWSHLYIMPMSVPWQLGMIMEWSEATV